MTDGKVEIGAALIVLFAAMMNGESAFVLSLAALIGLGLYRMLGPSHIDRVAAAKQQHLDAVVALAREKGEVANADVRAAHGVADSTAQRYFDELEEAGKLVQVGDTGRGVVYKIR